MAVSRLTHREMNLTLGYEILWFFNRVVTFETYFYGG